MSHQKQSFENCKFLASLKWGRHITVPGDTAEAVARNLKVAGDALRIWLGMVYDVCCVGSDWKAYEGRWKILCKTVFLHPITDLLEDLETLTAGLLETASDYHLRDWEAYKALTVQDGHRSEPVTILLGLMRKHVQPWFTSGDVTGFKSAYQILAFLNRLNFVKADELKRKALDGWYESERICSEPRSYDGDEKQILEEWFPLSSKDEIFSEYYPSHGHGAVAEGNLTIYEKWYTNTTNPRIEEFHRYIGFDAFSPLLMQRPYLTRDSWTDDCHKGTFVAKNWKTYRGISEEEVGRMFAQRGAMSAIYRFLRHHGNDLSYHYWVDSEDYNKRLAWEGSIDGSFATIDLTSASDSVALLLVESWFSSTCLYVPLRSLRSLYCKLKDTEYSSDYSIYKVAKYSPMGGALCFIVEVCVFAAVVESIVRHTPGVSRRYAIYGDDIVCDVRIAEKVCARLRELGFRPNLRKTYMSRGENSSDFFRESCGGEYLNGTDVTPRRISRKFNGLLPEGLLNYHDLSEDESSSVAQLISLANDLEGFPTSRYLLVRSLLDSGLPILFDVDGSKGIKTPNPTNFHIIEKRWNPDYQYWEAPVLVLHRERKDKLFYADYAEDLPSELRLFSYLSLAEKSARTRLLYPEDAVDMCAEPYSLELRCKIDWYEIAKQPHHRPE